MINILKSSPYRIDRNRKRLPRHSSTSTTSTSKNDNCGATIEERRNRKRLFYCGAAEKTRSGAPLLRRRRSSRFYWGAAIEERRNRKGYCSSPLLRRSSIATPAAVAVRGAAIKALLYGPLQTNLFNKKS